MGGHAAATHAGGQGDYLKIAACFSYRSIKSVTSIKALRIFVRGALCCWNDGYIFFTNDFNKEEKNAAKRPDIIVSSFLRAEEGRQQESRLFACCPHKLLRDIP